MDLHRVARIRRDEEQEIVESPGLTVAAVTKKRAQAKRSQVPLWPNSLLTIASITGGKGHNRQGLPIVVAIVRISSGVEIS